METSFCSFCLPNGVPVETLDPVTLCFLLQLWGLYAELFIESLMAWGPLDGCEYDVPHFTQEVSQMHVDGPEPQCIWLKSSHVCI